MDGVPIPRESTHANSETQSATGRSTLSITTISTGPVAGFNCNPSCSRTAEKISGASFVAVASPALQLSSMSYFPVRPLRSAVQSAAALIATLTQKGSSLIDTGN